VLKAVKRKGWAANRAKIPLMDLLCWHIAYKRRKNDSNKASCNIWDYGWYIKWCRPITLTLSRGIPVYLTAPLVIPLMMYR